MSEIDKQDLNRVHERIDNVENEQKEIKENFFNTLISVNKNLTKLNENVEQNDDKTDDLADLTDELADEIETLSQKNQSRKHQIEMHAANCPARQYHELADESKVKKGVHSIKEHPVISAGTLTGILVGIAKAVEVIL